MGDGLYGRFVAGVESIAEVFGTRSGKPYDHAAVEAHRGRLMDRLNEQDGGGWERGHSGSVQRVTPEEGGHIRTERIKPATSSTPPSYSIETATDRPSTPRIPQHQLDPSHRGYNPNIPGLSDHDRDVIARLSEVQRPMMGNTMPGVGDVRNLGRTASEALGVPVTPRLYTSSTGLMDSITYEVEPPGGGVPNEYRFDRKGLAWSVGPGSRTSLANLPSRGGVEPIISERFDRPDADQQRRMEEIAGIVRETSGDPSPAAPRRGSAVAAPLPLR